MLRSINDRIIRFCQRARAKLDSEINELRLTKGKRKEILQAQRKAFENAGLMFDSAIRDTTLLFRTLQVQRFDDSMHYEIFMAIGQIREFRRILEIGTSLGHFTSFLANLFPASEIHTWDLPSESFSDTAVDSYLAIRDGYGDQTLLSQARLDNLPNVVLVRRDSTQLIYETRLFDAIWVDGDHTFPVIAFDVINALRLVPVGGFICVDDIRQSDGKGSSLGLQETYKTVKHLANTGLVSLSLVRKRINVSNMLTKPIDAKYIAIMQRLI